MDSLIYFFSFPFDRAIIPSLLIARWGTYCLRLSAFVQFN